MWRVAVVLCVGAGAGAAEAVRELTLCARDGAVVAAADGVPLARDASSRPRVVVEGGIAGADCLAFQTPSAAEAPAAPVVINDPGVARTLDGAASLAVTAWISREIDTERSDRTQYLMNCPGRFFLRFGRWGRLCFGLYGSDGQRRDVWSSWLSTTELSPGKRWVFVAATWDGSRASICIGGDRYPVAEDVSIAADPASLASAPAQRLIVGAYDPDGKTPFRGTVDRVRIAATAGRTASYRHVDVAESRRRGDLGEGWLKELRLARTRRTTREAEHFRELGARHWNGPLSLHQVDSLEAVFADRPPVPCSATVHTPRNSRLGLLFAARAGSAATTRCKARLAAPARANGLGLRGESTVNAVVHVPVEANNNGGMRTAVGVRPPPRWMEHLTRAAPFEVAEVIVPATDIELPGGDSAHDAYRALLLDVRVAGDAEPGRYEGSLALTTEDGLRADAPFCLVVHETTLPDDMALHTHLWLMPEPENLRPGDPPAWWSEEHWDLLEQTGKTLRAFYQDTITVPLLDRGPHSLVTAIREVDGSHSFDFSGFDRWVRLFLALGFRRVAGTHLLHMPGMGYAATDHRRYAGIFELDRATGEKRPLFPLKHDRKEWLQFAEIFCRALHAHLCERGWTDLYLQHQYDEPSKLDLYRQVADVTRSCMPGVRTIDATKTKPEYSPFVDLMVFDIGLFRADAQALAATRRGQGRETWFYHCASPYPPYPNRHLDEPLTNSRLYPWLAYTMKAQGYLWWAVNVYRGADPYATSVGPLPGGSQTPGHGPGDNWMYYPGPQGLRGGMRMLAFREGLTDHTLLTMLARRDQAAADRIARGIARNPVDCSRRPADYHGARRELLEALDASSDR